jgi:hypothetical protein
MPQENVEVVRRIIDAINRRGVDAVVESVTDDFVADWSNSRGLLSGVHRGRDHAREASSRSSSRGTRSDGSRRS